MHLGWNSARAFVALALVGVLSGACGKDSGMKPATAPQLNEMGLSAATTQTNAAPVQASAAGGSTKGAAGQMPAYYDGRLLTINSVELPEDASAATIASNQSLNEIYATNDLDDEQDFFPVISAIQGDGFNPLWRQILIHFNPGVTPHQFFSDDEVVTAASGANPEITLDVTDEVYRCSVVAGKK
jgi:hypothetical protein